MDNIDIIDTSKFYFTKNKYKNIYKKTNAEIFKKNYPITDINKNRLSFEIKNSKSTFGIEEYNKQKILNIIIDPNKNNEHYNLFVSLKKLEEELSKSKIKDTEIANEIENKKYYSILKYNANNNNYFLRTYILGTPNIYTIINGKKFSVLESDIKNKNINLKLEFGTLWITDNDYGILIYLKDIIL